MRRVSSVLFRTFAAARGGCAVRFHNARFYGSTTGCGAPILRRWFYTPEVPHHSLPYDLILYQCEYSPTCNVVTAILDYYSIPYKVVEVSSVSKKEIRWSEYRRVPILILHGEQLNGLSAIMDKLGEKILSKERARAESISYVQETKWLQWVDNRLTPVLLYNIFRSTSEAREAFDCFLSKGKFNYLEKIAVKLGGFSFFPFRYLLQNQKKHYNITDERAALYEAAEMWVDALNGREFLRGSKPDFADLTVFGSLKPIRYLSAGKDMMEHTHIAILDYYGIPYKVVEVSLFSMKEIRWSKYRRVPILMLHGEQLNGPSAIIDKLGDKFLS